MNPLTNVKIKLVGEDGNAFYILGKVKKELKRNGYDKDFINQFMEEATAGDYDKLLQTVMKYVIVE
jgi:hypothetical protein